MDKSTLSKNPLTFWSDLSANSLTGAQTQMLLDYQSDGLSNEVINTVLHEALIRDKGFGYAITLLRKVDKAGITDNADKAYKQIAENNSSLGRQQKQEPQMENVGSSDKSTPGDVLLAFIKLVSIGRLEDGDTVPQVDSNELAQRLKHGGLATQMAQYIANQEVSARSLFEAFPDARQILRELRIETYKQKRANKADSS